MNQKLKIVKNRISTLSKAKEALLEEMTSLENDMETLKRDAKLEILEEVDSLNEKFKEEESFFEFLQDFNKQISVINEKIKIVRTKLSTLNNDKKLILEDILEVENEEKALKTREEIETSEEVLEDLSEDMSDLLGIKDFLRQDLSSLEDEIYMWESQKKVLLEEKKRLISFYKLFQHTRVELTREREKVVLFFNILLQIAQEKKKKKDNEE